MSQPDISKNLVNPNSDSKTKKLMNYICDIYGKRILSGQQSDGLDSSEILAIFNETGKYPAICGFDFIEYSPSRVAYGTKGVHTEKAIEWWNAGGIVTFCWHWNAPKDLIDEEPDKRWYRGFYTIATNFDIKKAMEDTSSEEYELILRDIDVISEEMKKLQNAGVPILWRPLHEASGGWFWWGAKGPESCIKLWKLMYHRMTDYHKLNNLIWVWNGEHNDWYPGNDYVDIISKDIYAGPRVYNSQVEKFFYAQSCTKENKIVALSENGTIPDPDLLIKDKAAWAWFCTWAGVFAYKNDEDGNVVYSGHYTEYDMLKKVYSHPYVITRDGLPNIKVW